MKTNQEAERLRVLAEEKWGRRFYLPQLATWWDNAQRGTAYRYMDGPKGKRGGRIRTRCNEVSGEISS